MKVRNPPSSGKDIFNTGSGNNGNGKGNSGKPYGKLKTAAASVWSGLLLAEDRENADLSQLMPVDLKVEKAAEAGAGEATGAAAKPAAETTSEAEPADEAAAEPTGQNRWNFRFWKRRPARRKIQTEN